MNTLEGKAWRAMATVKGIGSKALWQAADFLIYYEKPASWLLRNPEKVREALKGVRGNIIIPDPDLLEKGEGTVSAEQDVTVLHPLHLAFPRRIKDLKEKLLLPAILYASGNLALLERQSVSIIGRRDADREALSVAKKLASQLAAAGINVTSGYAAGIDSAAHIGALRNMGTTTLVLAEGLDHFKLKPEFKGLLNEDNALVISQFASDAGWAAFQAMARNKLVAALSNVLVVIVSGLERDAAGRRSGTFDAAISAFKLGLPVFVAVPSFFGDSPIGNQELIRKGGIAWDPGSGVAPILKVMKATAMKKVPEQKRLF